jgi:hypothetical protein
VPKTISLDIVPTPECILASSLSKRIVFLSATGNTGYPFLISPIAHFF